MQSITREQVKQKIDSGGDVTVVEVLAPEQYREFHLPGAINVPVGANFVTEIQGAVPDKQAEVVVYCLNKECQASPMAAEMMDKLGYRHVYDYEEGKQDWQQAGMPVER